MNRRDPSFRTCFRALTRISFLRGRMPLGVWVLEDVPGIQFVDFERPDECCGFGGTFSPTEEAVAAKPEQAGEQRVILN